MRALPGGRTAEARCRPWDRLRSMSQPGEPGAGTRTSLGSRTLQHRAIPEERPSDLPRSAATSGGCGGLCPPAAWDTTALDVWRWQPHTSRGQSSSMLYQSCTDRSGDCGVDISLSLIPLWPRLVCVAHALWPGNDARGHRQASFELILWSCTAAQLFPLLSLPSCVSVLLRVERLASSVLARTLIRCLVHAPS